jgi:hypothetical protein
MLKKPLNGFKAQISAESAGRSYRELPDGLRDLEVSLLPFKLEFPTEYSESGLV